MWGALLSVNVFQNLLSPQASRRVGRRCRVAIGIYSSRFNGSMSQDSPGDVPTEFPLYPGCGIVAQLARPPDRNASPAAYPGDSLGVTLNRIYSDAMLKHGPGNRLPAENNGLGLRADHYFPRLPAPFVFMPGRPVNPNRPRPVYLLPGQPTSPDRDPVSS
jgi:hypothetical protein